MNYKDTLTTIRNYLGYRNQYLHGNMNYFLEISYTNDIYAKSQRNSSNSFRNTRNRTTNQSQRENDLRPMLVPMMIVVLVIFTSCPERWQCNAGNPKSHPFFSPDSVLFWVGFVQAEGKKNATPYSTWGTPKYFLNSRKISKSFWEHVQPLLLTSNFPHYAQIDKWNLS